MDADIWVPNSRPDQITVYVDETYFDGKSGLIQVGLPIPAAGDREFKKAVDLMRKGLPRFQLTTFKAVKLNKRNANAYRKFLKCVINLLGLVGDASQLRAVVTVEGTERSAGWERDFILSNVDKTFAALSARPERPARTHVL